MQNLGQTYCLHHCACRGSATFGELFWSLLTSGGPGDHKLGVTQPVTAAAMVDLSGGLGSTHTSVLEWFMSGDDLAKLASVPQHK